MMGFSYEKRPLKRPRLGPPDVYPQDPKQKEDELTTVNVKHGFTTLPQLAEEFGTARNSNISASKVGAYFNAILSKKEELNTLPDTGRKRQQINPKDNFWPATARTKNAIEAWFKDLAGSKPLSSLSKKAPNFNKKDEIFTMLCEYQVPMLRAAWFIKLSSAYTVAVSEAKIKKRQLPDPSQEWTQTLIKFLKDQLQKLQEYYHSSSGTSGAGATAPNASPSGPPHLPASTFSSISGSPNCEEHGPARRQWHYCIQLANHLYEEGLLEQQEYLQWILELLDKVRTPDDGILRLILPLALQYLDEFVRSELLARKLAHACARKLARLCTDHPLSSTTSTTNSARPGSNGNDDRRSGNQSCALARPNSVSSSLNEYLHCPLHREVILSLSAIIQAITLDCPTALVWNCVGEGRGPSILDASPLDHLPCPPSILPLPLRSQSARVRMQISLAEEGIRQRSRAAEGRWSCDRCQQSTAESQMTYCCLPGITTTKVLSALEALDRHCFDRVDATNSLDVLYSKIFSPLGNRDNSGDYRPPAADEAVVRTLCEWAVSTRRSGEHRAIAVAALLERRQADLLAAGDDPAGGEGNNQNGGTGGEEGDSASSGLSPGLPSFQPMLMNFLDDDAPVLDENPSLQNRAMFANLVHLFYELIRHDVFSHDAYMCTLISRGDRLSGVGVTPGPPTTASNRPRARRHPSGSGRHPGTPAGEVEEDPPVGTPLFPAVDLVPTKTEDHARTMDYDDSKIDDDLDKLLQHIKEEQQNSMDAPDSPKDEPPPAPIPPPLPVEEVPAPGSAPEPARQSRHLLYTTHFPLPQDDTFSNHDSNQRHVLLYGVGKERDEARHIVKKTTKEISKLFGKKFSIDVAEGGKVKRHSRGEFSFEGTMQRVHGGLSYFDQHVVTVQCAAVVIEMLAAFGAGSSNYLPVQEHVAFLFDLMELSLNIYGLIDFCIQILKELPEVEAQLVAKGSPLARSYTTSLCLYVVGVLRRYHCCLLLSLEQTTSVFEGLCRAVKHVTNPGDCSSAERCVLAHLYDLYSSCAPLKAKPCEPFSNAYPKIRQALYSPVLPSQSNCVCNAQFMAEALNGTGRGGGIFGGSVSVGGTTPVGGSATPTGAGSGGGATPTSSGGQGSTPNSVSGSTSLPGRRIEAQWVRQLSESAANRYSFVCNTVVAVCSEMDIDRVNELAVLAAELTASCNALSSEWLGVLTALCCSSNHRSFFIDVQAQVDIQDLSIHNSLAVFTSILIARHCFSLEDFVVHVALPSLVRAGNEGRGEADSEAEAGARLACHLLLRLFGTPLQGGTLNTSQSAGSSPMPLPINEGYGIKLSCDRHLLAAALKNIRVGAVLAVLKAILVLGDATARDNRSRKGDQGKGSVGSSGGNVSGSGELSISHILGTSDILGGGDESQRDLGAIAGTTPTARGVGDGGPESTVSLSEFARHVLRRICGREWVLERCLQNPEELCHPEMLLDNMLTPTQAQRLLRMICHPETAEAGEDPPDQRRVVASILENLDQWTLRMSWLDLQLMFRQFSSNSAELSQWLDIVAKAAIDVFQVSGGGDSSRSTEERSQGGKGMEADLPPTRTVGSRGKEEPEIVPEGNRRRGAVGSSAERKGHSTHSNGASSSQRKGCSDAGKANSMWLVAPLVSKLPPAVQGRVLRVAGQVLESGNWSSSRGRDRERGARRGSSLLSHQPFLSLVLTCLGGQDDQREGLLASLHSQLNQFLVLSKDERLCNTDGLDTRSRVLMQDALRLRFSLVGGMFDTIRRNTTTTTDWAILLVQLVSHGVVDLNNNSELFTTVIDMLSTLIHSTLVSDSQSEKGDENKKHYQNLIKKLKKELGDRASPSLRHIRQLLPLPKRTREVVACEPVGLLTDTKGNKIAGFDSIDKKQGLQVAEKLRVAPWDLLEGHRNPAPLSWAWFGAVRVERRPLWYEDTHRLLRYHTHSLLRSPSHFLDPPPLPVEDPEPPREKMCLCVYCIRPKEETDAGTPDSGHSPNRGTPSGPGGAAMGDVGGAMGPGGVPRPPPGMAAAAAAVPPKRAKPTRRRRSKAAANAVAQQGRPQPTLPPPPTQPPHPGAAAAHLRAGVPNVNTADASMQQFQQTVGNHMGFDPNRGPYNAQPPPPHQWPPQANVQQQQQQQQRQVQQAQQQRQPQQQQQVRQPQMQRQPGAQPTVVPQGNQQQYYSQQMAPAPVTGGPRFERPVNQSKQALSNMLRMRHPTTQFLGTQQPAQPQAPFQNMQRQQFIRQQLRAQHMPGGMQPPQPQQQTQFPNPGPGTQPPMYPSVPQESLQSHLGMGQSYGGYISGPGGVPQQMMQRQAASGAGQQPNPQQAMGHNFAQSGYLRQQRPPQQGGGGGVGGMQGVGGDGSGGGGYVGGGPGGVGPGVSGASQVQHSNPGMAPGMRPQFVQAPNVTMGAPGSGGQGVPCTQGSGGVVGSQYGRPTQQTMQQAGAQGTPQQFQQAVRLRQQMMAMQQQQQAGAGGASGPTPALVAHLQRQLNGSNPGNQPGQMGASTAPGQGPQGHYHHRPPPY
ncbi:mediator of RNA polymerase II transcription subunit 12-like protein isoform X2 [Ischnura elegans]|uniref:mediator of RNA polymerase II transcription subunit 12-like protein isoform X2 n=1 Tax=Ischnura elegans TaxID=197161 RepID=UPI001ED87D83|nr:mediator of RNA polymerase II transcription subunit 12-like protein isoform X2 [Ischnura elegans]